jgi:hypothetical protein
VFYAPVISAESLTDFDLRDGANVRGSLLWSHLAFKLLKTKRNLLYISNQSVPRCKHFPPRL